MNCERVREDLVSSLAAGECPISRELEFHLRSCEGCRSYYEIQAALLLSIDSGLQTMMNQQVPASLLPGLRARMSQQPAPRIPWIPGWGFAAAIAAVAVLTFTFGPLLRRPETHPKFSANSTIAPVRGSNPSSSEQFAPKLEVTQRPFTHKPADPVIPVPVSSEPSTEVIVLAEERTAFAHFVSALPKNPDLATALTHPAPFPPDLPMEIALLRIDSLEVEPLSATPRE